MLPFDLAVLVLARRLVVLATSLAALVRAQRSCGTAARRGRGSSWDAAAEEEGMEKEKGIAHGWAFPEKEKG